MKLSPPRVADPICVLYHRPALNDRERFTLTTGALAWALSSDTPPNTVVLATRGTRQMAAIVGVDWRVVGGSESMKGSEFQDIQARLCGINILGSYRV